jgi:hypothetical protein
MTNLLFEYSMLFKLTLEYYHYSGSIAAPTRLSVVIVFCLMRLEFSIYRESPAGLRRAWLTLSVAPSTGAVTVKAPTDSGGKRAGVVAVITGAGG